MVVISRLIAKFNSYYADKPSRSTKRRPLSFRKLTHPSSTHHHHHKRRTPLSFSAPTMNVW